LDQKITVLAKQNPKARGSACHRRFAKYRSGMTVKAALAAGVLREDLHWDNERKFIRIA
jgi:hypothetical protein